jgi:hypothetical protein
MAASYLEQAIGKTPLLKNKKQQAHTRGIWRGILKERQAQHSRADVQKANPVKSSQSVVRRTILSGSVALSYEY